MGSIAVDRKENRSQTFGIEIAARNALFADPVIATGGERLSMQIPTYEALTGILRSIYYKPGMIFEVEKLRVVNPIQFESKAVLLPNYNKCGGINEKDLRDLAYFTYLKDVKYQIHAHFYFDKTQVNLYQDFIFGKHEAIFKRSLAAGGRRDIFLGRRECQGYVTSIPVGDEWPGEGAYDDVAAYPLGMMYHGLTYPNMAYDEKTKGHLTMNMFSPVMKADLES